MKLTFTFLTILLVNIFAIGQTYQVTANINSANEVPPVSSEANGNLTGTYDASTNTISLNATYANLEGTLTASHLHKAAAGTNGGVIVNLLPTTGMNSGSITGTFSIAEGDETELINGGVYINLHSTVYGGGEIRGQLALTLLPASLCASEVTFGDLCIKDNTKGIILKSPNGTCFRIQVGDTGVLASTQVTCP